MALLLAALFAVLSSLPIESDDDDISDEYSIAITATLNGFDNPTYVLPMEPSRLLVAENKRVRLVPLEDTQSAITIYRQFEYPTGLAQIGEYVYAAQQSGRGLQRFLMDGTILASVGSMAAGRHPHIDSALGVAAGGGMIFVADVTAYRVTAFDDKLQNNLWITGQGMMSAEFRRAVGCTVRQSSPGTPFQGPSCFNPHGLAWSPRHGGRLFVADADNDAIVVLDAASGVHVRTVLGSDDLFRSPRGLGMTPSGRLLVAERTRVVMLSPGGRRRLARCSVPGASSMLGVGVDARHHRAYIADPGSNAIYVLALRGENDGTPRKNAVAQATVELR